MWAGSVYSEELSVTLTKNGDGQSVNGEGASLAKRD